jgi:hypothetical protein
VEIAKKARFIHHQTPFSGIRQIDKYGVRLKENQ